MEWTKFSSYLNTVPNFHALPLVSDSPPQPCIRAWKHSGTNGYRLCRHVLTPICVTHNTITQMLRYESFPDHGMLATPSTMSLCPSPSKGHHTRGRMPGTPNQKYRGVIFAGIWKVWFCKSFYWMYSNQSSSPLFNNSPNAFPNILTQKSFSLFSPSEQEPVIWRFFLTPYIESCFIFFNL